MKFGWSPWDPKNCTLAITVEASAEFFIEALRASQGVPLSGFAIATAPFVPSLYSATLSATAFFSGDGMPNGEISRGSTETDKLRHLEIAGIAFDGKGLFPKRPEGQKPIPLSLFASDCIGGGVSFPRIDKDAQVDLVIRPSLLDWISTFRPLDGYDPEPRRIAVKAAITWRGPELR